jgi:hypothetical protein
MSTGARSSRLVTRASELVGISLAEVGSTSKDLGNGKGKCNAKNQVMVINDAEDD